MGQLDSLEAEILKQREELQNLQGINSEAQLSKEAAKVTCALVYKWYSMHVSSKGIRGMSQSVTRALSLFIYLCSLNWDAYICRFIYIGIPFFYKLCKRNFCSLFSVSVFLVSEL